MSRNRRRNILINKDLQMKYTGLFLLIVFFYSLCLGYTVYHTNRITTVILEDVRFEDPTLKERLEKLDRSIFAKTMAVMTINAFVIAFIGIIASHRVAGPLYRLQRYTEMVRDGVYAANLKFRKGDQLMDMAVKFNEMMDSLKSRVETDVEEICNIVNRIRGVVATLKEGQQPDENILRTIEELIGQLDELRKAKFDSINRS